MWADFASRYVQQCLFGQNRMRFLPPEFRRLDSSRVTARDAYQQNNKLSFGIPTTRLSASCPPLVSLKPVGSEMHLFLSASKHKKAFEENNNYCRLPRLYPSHASFPAVASTNVSISVCVLLALPIPWKRLNRPLGVTSVRLWYFSRRTRFSYSLSPWSILDGSC